MAQYVGTLDIAIVLLQVLFAAAPGVIVTGSSDHGGESMHFPVHTIVVDILDALLREQYKICGFYVRFTTST